MLNRVNLINASLFSANLEGATFNQVNLTGANLQYANFENTIWDRVDFSNCQVEDAVFTDAQGLTSQQVEQLQQGGAVNVSYE
jgi:uncharacterized protein YjbI with pentapeptide repeats